jgi:hypothetical protein
VNYLAPPTARDPVKFCRPLAICQSLKDLHPEEAQHMLPMHQVHQYLYTLFYIDSARV